MLFPSVDYVPVKGEIPNREKEGAHNLCDSMDGIREHYAKQNKPSGEGQILYEVTLNRFFRSGDLVCGIYMHIFLT